MLEQQRRAGREEAEVYVRRATLFSLMGAWERSRDDAARALELNPSLTVGGVCARLDETMYIHIQPCVLGRNDMYFYSRACFNATIYVYTAVRA